MAHINFKDLPVNTSTHFVAAGEKAKEFSLVKNDLSTATLKQYQGKRILLNIFPSIDTGICATSVRTFNQKASQLTNTVVLCISKDLPFAQARFCGAEGINNVQTLSAFKNDYFGKDYGVLMSDGPLQGLLARAVVVIDEKGDIIYSQLVNEITDEPDYDKAIAALA